ncbi:hypothetical protein BH11BAC7_BH11BAC7_24410 [soil metagenome]
MQTYSDHASETDSHAIANGLSKEKSSSASAFPSPENHFSSKQITRTLPDEIAVQPAPSANDNSIYQAKPVASKSNHPVQLFADEEEAAEKGILFRTLSNRERTYNREITTLLQSFQDTPTQGNHEMLMDEMEERRLEIKKLHVLMVAIVDEFAIANGGQQRAYFGAYLADKIEMEDEGLITRDQILAVFNSVMAKTEAVIEMVPGLPVEDDDEVPLVAAPMAAERSRFLMYMMQGLHDDMGVEQYRVLNENLGEGGRKLKVGRVGSHDLSGGMEDAIRDNQYARKTDDGEINHDDQDWTTGGGTVGGFLRSKFSRPYDRGQNPQRNQIGDMQINMDQGDELLPIFSGLDDDRARLFSPPKKMAVHHEIGHINSMLEGRSGGGKRMTGETRSLTDQEEMYNIWGGPRSDRAYGESLGLPERFDHTSGMSYTGPGSARYRDFGLMLNEIKGVNSPNKPLGAEIKRLVDSNWRKITKGIWFKPDGVKDIKALVDVSPANPDFAAISDIAITNRDKPPSTSRHPFTVNFYTALAGIDPGDPASISTAFRALRPMVVPQQWD